MLDIYPNKWRNTSVFGLKWVTMSKWAVAIQIEFIWQQNFNRLTLIQLFWTQVGHGITMIRQLPIIWVAGIYCEDQLPVFNTYQQYYHIRNYSNQSNCLVHLSLQKWTHVLLLYSWSYIPVLGESWSDSHGHGQNGSRVTAPAAAGGNHLPTAARSAAWSFGIREGRQVLRVVITELKHFKGGQQFAGLLWAAENLKPFQVWRFVIVLTQIDVGFADGSTQKLCLANL